MNGQRDWIESIKKLPAFVHGAIGFVTLVIGFIVLFQDNVHLGIVVSAALTLIATFCLCIYLAFARTPPLVEGGRGVYRFEKHRRWAFVGILLIPVLFVVPLVAAPSRSFVIMAFVGPVTPMPPPTATPTLTPTTDAAYTPPPVAVSPVPPRPTGWIFYGVAKPVEYQDIEPSNLIKLRQFALLRSATSFVETEEPLFAAGPRVKTYAMDDFLMMNLIDHGCTGEIDSALPRIREALQHYAEQRGRSELLPYVETEEQIVSSQ